MWGRPLQERDIKKISGKVRWKTRINKLRGKGTERWGVKNLKKEENGRENFRQGKLNTRKPFQGRKNTSLNQRYLNEVGFDNTNQSTSQKVQSSTSHRNRMKTTENSLLSEQFYRFCFEKPRIWVGILS
jgi:hypothetical protein